MKQAEKHLETKIINAVRDGKWPDGKPVLHYEWKGAAFHGADGSVNIPYVTERIKAIRDVCRKIMGPVKVDPVFDCDKDVTFNIGSLLIEPLNK